MGELSEKIDTLLIQKGVSGYKMCHDLGMSRSFMTELRKGRAKSINITTAQKIASYFGVSVGYLLGTEDKEKSASKKKAKKSIAPLLYAILIKKANTRYRHVVFIFPQFVCLLHYEICPLRFKRRGNFQPVVYPAYR